MRDLGIPFSSLIFDGGSVLGIGLGAQWPDFTVLDFGIACSMFLGCNHLICSVELGSRQPYLSVLDFGTAVLKLSFDGLTFDGLTMVSRGLYFYTVFAGSE